jgi:HEAT repeat protein
MLVAIAPVVSAQQQQPAITSQEALLLAQGYGYLSIGDAPRAADAAAQVLTQFPLSDAGVSLAIDAELVRSGWSGALDVYERWLAARRAEAPYALRRVARACLREALKDLSTRNRAIEALVADGDQQVLKDATAASAAGKFADTQALAAVGDEGAVRLLIAQLDAMPDARGPAIQALATSHSRLAIAPLVKLLDDPNSNTRAAAIDALGQLGAQETADKIRPLLEDSKQPFFIKFVSARALGRLGDSSGVAFLRQILDNSAPTPEMSQLRVDLAGALAAIGPDTGWQDTARSLLNDPAPNVRADAARILAPYDNAASKSALDVLLTDPNPAIRQKSAQILAQDVAGDYATLRRLLRSSDAEARTSAAARLLEITR